MQFSVLVLFMLEPKSYCANALYLIYYVYIYTQNLAFNEKKMDYKDRSFGTFADFFGDNSL
ncbi:hypothetical protein CCAN12_770097 [Capnocytophaga canimorsus]|uniref:Uncharacterized protein n=1 Tax=Capnocytophaga canimorsus TaxID=28188 RepID=A0A0B7HMN9_9FLAO|nr:hypothetical protein CAPN007_20790 [Capnocytophaga canimorsus]CEN39919.1 hypothetical protein CCAN12_770097 [Capnocytophaga canimorsus]